MDRKEILEKNKEKNRSGLDEREQRVYNFSFGVGAVIVGVLCLVFSLYKALNREPFYEYVVIITAYLCTVFIYQFKNLKRLRYLISGIVTGVAAAVCMVLFFMV